MHDDIVTRLREAADEIELMRSHMTDLNIEIEMLRKECAEKNERELSSVDMLAVLDQISEDRDKARRMVCEMEQSQFGQNQLWWAKLHGWDCFKETNDE